MRSLTGRDVELKAVLGGPMNTHPYRGPLTPAEVAQGMAAARRNAIRLASDATALLASRRWPSAASLAILSIEESGKVGLLRRLAVAITPNALNDAWKGYRWHGAKLKAPIGINPEGLSMADPTARAEAIEVRTKLAGDLNSLKQIGFYSDCALDGDERPKWTEPANRITEDVARAAVECAVLLARKAPVSVREVELFVQHMGPVADSGDMVSAWQCWTVAMDAEGLLDAPLEEVQDRVLDEFFGRGWRDQPI